MKTKQPPTSAIAELDPEMLAIVEAFATAIVRIKAQDDERKALIKKLEKAALTPRNPDVGAIEQNLFNDHRRNDRQAGPKLMRIVDVSDYLSMSKGTIYRKIKEGTFPSPKKLGHSVRWTSADIEAWIEGLSESKTRNVGD